MAFFIEPSIWEKFPGMRLVVAVASGLDNRTERPGVTKLLEEAQDELQAGWELENPQSIRGSRPGGRRFRPSG